MRSTVGKVLCGLQVSLVALAATIASVGAPVSAHAGRDRFPEIPGLRVATEMEIGTDRYPLIMNLFDMHQVRELVPNQDVPTDLYARYLDDDRRLFFSLPEDAQALLTFNLKDDEKAALHGKPLIAAKAPPATGPALSPELPSPLRPIATPKLDLGQSGGLTSAPAWVLPGNVSVSPVSGRIPLAPSPGAPSMKIPAVADTHPAVPEEYSQLAQAAKVRAAWEKVFAAWRSLPFARQEALADPDRLSSLEKARLFSAVHLPWGKKNGQTGDGWRPPLRADVPADLREFLTQRMEIEYFPLNEQVEFRHKAPVHSFDALEADELRLARLVGAELWYRDPAKRPEVGMSLHTHVSKDGGNFGDIVEAEKLRILLQRIAAGGKKATTNVAGTSAFGSDGVGRKDVIRLFARDRFEQRGREGTRLEQLRRLAWLASGKPEDVARAIRAEIASLITPESLSTLWELNKNLLDLLRKTIEEHPSTHASVLALADAQPVALLAKFPGVVRPYLIEHLDRFMRSAPLAVSSLLDTEPNGSPLFPRLADFYARNPDLTPSPRVLLNAPTLVPSPVQIERMLRTGRPQDELDLMDSLLSHSERREALLRTFAESTDTQWALQRIRGLDGEIRSLGGFNFGLFEADQAPFLRKLDEVRKQVHERGVESLRRQGMIPATSERAAGICNRMLSRFRGR